VTTPQQPPPPRKPSATDDAVRAAQDAAISAALPALSAFTQGVMSFARAGGRVAGSPLTVATKIGYDAAIIALLVKLAHGALGEQRDMVGRRQSEGLWEHADEAAQAGVNGGLAVLKSAAQHIARAARVDEATGGSPGVSLPGEPYDPHAHEHAKTYSDPERIALPFVQATRHTAQIAAAEAAGWRYKVWNDVHDNRVRPAHAFLGAPKYEFHRVPIAEPFVDIEDHKLWFPGDTEAPPHTWMNCRCYLTFVKGHAGAVGPLLVDNA